MQTLLLSTLFQDLSASEPLTGLSQRPFWQQFILEFTLYHSQAYTIVLGRYACWFPI